MSKGLLAAVSALMVLPTSSQAQRTPPPIVRNEPATEAFGDWVVEARATYFGAYTNNESGTSFGVLCGKECVAYASSAVECKPNQLYPALINSDGGAHSVVFKCLIVEGTYVYATDFTESVVEDISAGGRIGIAMPLADGRFSVSRYSLRGSLQAVARASDLAKRKNTKPGTDNGQLRDFAI